MDVFRILVAAVLSIAAAVPPGAAGVSSRFEYSESHMGTLVRIVLYAPGAQVADGAAKAAFDRIGALDAAFSDYRDSSELIRLSRQSGGGPVEVSDDLFRVLRAAQRVARESDGAFDVTVGPLSVLWRRARRVRELPDAASIAAARALVGADKLELDDRRRTARLTASGMQLDLGGIAKGFAADEASAVLKRIGVQAALVAAGGDIVATGTPPGKDGWRVAIASLEGADRAPAGFVDLRNAAVSTSGDAEQFVVLDGVRYSHIVDPRTGAALTGRRSVTIVARDGTTSDALATAVSVLGAVKGLALVESSPAAAAFVSESAGGGVRSYESSRWRTRHF
jgi:thiamine biosynthesis lipoprotein